jgi:hypothetical protein
MDDFRTFTDEYTNQSLSTIHHALRATRRRLAVGLVSHRYIASSPHEQESSRKKRVPDCTQVSVRRLAKEITAIEQETAPEHATGEAYRNVYTALVQTHLPELDKIDAIAYDGDRKVVRPDRNLVALMMIISVSSPIAQMLFNDAVARSSRSELSVDGSIGD